MKGDQCPYKRKFRHRVTEERAGVDTGSRPIPPCKSKRKASEETDPDYTLFLYSILQNCEKIKSAI